MLETMCQNWQRVCDQMQEEEVEMSRFEREKKVLMKIERNVYHRKTASPVIITKVSFASEVLHFDGTCVIVTG